MGSKFSIKNNGQQPIWVTHGMDNKLLVILLVPLAGGAAIAVVAAACGAIQALPFAIIAGIACPGVASFMHDEQPSPTAVKNGDGTYSLSPGWQNKPGTAFAGKWQKLMPGQSYTS